MRKKVLKISIIITAFTIAAGFAVQGHHRSIEYQRQLENSYTHAFHELTNAVAELDTALQKIQYANTLPMFHLLCTDIYGKSVTAQMALGELPNSEVLLEQTSAFLTRIGDYACALAHSAVISSALSEQALSTLSQLALATSHLAASLLELQCDLTGRTIDIHTLIQVESLVESDSSKSEAAPGGTAFQAIESQFPEIPTLIYDGPFSEHLSNKTPVAIASLPYASQDEARAAAADFLSLRPEVLTPVGHSDGVIPTWSFSTAADGGELYIEVTQQGCKVLSLFTSRSSTDIALSEQDAILLAQDFLAAQGYAQMQESYHVNQGGILTVNFFPVQQDVICYPDLVKVSVALDTGDIIGFESHGWIMNHTNRHITTGTIDVKTASKTLAPALTVLSHQLAFIPTDGENEVLCHEFKCKTPYDTNVIVYINADTGNEEQILLLLEDKNGTLVW